MNSHSWRDDAACTNADPELFYPSLWGKAAADAALNYCQHCPVVKPCLEFALAAGDDWGVAGNMTGSDRRKLRRRRAATQKPAPDLPTFRTVP